MGLRRREILLSKEGDTMESNHPTQHKLSQTHTIDQEYSWNAFLQDLSILQQLSLNNADRNQKRFQHW